jgi:hypothetical protein
MPVKQGQRKPTVRYSFSASPHAFFNSSANLYPAKAACFSATTFAALVYPSGNSRAISLLVPPFNSPWR